LDYSLQGDDPFAQSAFDDINTMFTMDQYKLPCIINKPDGSLQQSPFFSSAAQTHLTRTP
jgi:hypothetical protein